MKSLMLIALATSSITAGENFNLRCHGELEVMAQTITHEAISRTYRIDVAQNSWCADQCDKARPILQATGEPLGSDVLSLALEEDDHHEWNLLLIDNDGELQSEGEMMWMEHKLAKDPMTKENVYRSMVRGFCDRAAFTPIPANAFGGA